MTFEKFDWRKTIQQAGAWRGLSDQARKRLLIVNSMIDLDGLSTGDVKILCDGRLLASGKPKGDVRRLAIDEKWVTFVRLLNRTNPLAMSVGIQFYLEQFFSHQHLADFARTAGYYGAAHQLAASNVNTRQWVEGFLAASSLTAWLKSKQAKSRPLAAMSEAFADAQSLVRTCLEWTAPAPLDELEQHAGDLGFDRALRALRLCLHYFTLFVGFRRDGALAVDLLPAVGRRLRSATPERPETVDVAESFECPFALDDAIALVAFASRQNIRLKQQDGRMFAADEKAIAAEMIEAPTWLFPDAKAGAAARLRAARARGVKLKLLKEATHRGRQSELLAAPAAAKWLAQPRADRLREMLEASEVRKPLEWTSIPSGVSQHMLETRPEFRDLLRSALCELPTDRFYGIQDFVFWRAMIAAASPKLNGWLRAHQANWYGERLTLEWLEEKFSQALVRFVFGEMLPLGAVCVGLRPRLEGEDDDDDDDEYDDYDFGGDAYGGGYASGGYSGGYYDERLGEYVTHAPYIQVVGASDASRRAALAIRLTAAGEYLLGQRDDLHEAAAPAEAQIVVQPNFEIAFLGRAPSQEARVSRYAERTGRGVGVLFRLTKASIVGYAAAGGSAEALLAELTSLAAKGVPSNVEREIRGWFAQCRKVAVRQATIVECPDAETAGRVRAALGKQARLIGDAYLEIPGERPSPELFRKLAKAGIFVE